MSEGALQDLQQQLRGDPLVLLRKFSPSIAGSLGPASWQPIAHNINMYSIFLNIVA